MSKFIGDYVSFESANVKVRAKIVSINDDKLVALCPKTGYNYHFYKVNGLWCLASSHISIEKPSEDDQKVESSSYWLKFSGDDAE